MRGKSFYSLCGCPSISAQPQRKYIFGMYFPFSCLIRLQLSFSSFDAFLARKTFVLSNGEILVRHVRTHLRYRIFLKYSHCHHRNHLNNPYIQSHYPKSSPQGLVLDLELSLMTKTGFLHLQRRWFPTPFCLLFLARHPRNIHACFTRAMAQFFLKIAHLSFSMGPAPSLKMVFSYGLRPPGDGLYIPHPSTHLPLTSPLSLLAQRALETSKTGRRPRWRPEQNSGKIKWKRA